MVKFSLLTVALTAFLITFVNGADYIVNVGGNGKNAFIPPNFDAIEGDTVTFRFVGGTHDVVQSDAAGKCVKSVSATAFNTQRNVGDAKNPPKAVWTLSTVGEQNYFCSVEGHCAGGMVGKINVLAKGSTITNPGAEAPPPQQEAPADSRPQQPTPAPSSPSAPASPPKTKNAASADKQMSVAVVGGALLSFVSYFL